MLEKQRLKRWLAIFLVICLTSSPLQTLAEVITQDVPEVRQEFTASPSDAQEEESVPQATEFKYDPQPQSAEEVEKIISEYEEALDQYIRIYLELLASDSDAAEMLLPPSLPKWKDAIEDEKWIPETWYQDEFTDEATGSLYWSLVVGIMPMADENVQIGGTDGVDLLEINLTPQGGINPKRQYDPGGSYQRTYYDNFHGNGLAVWVGGEIDNYIAGGYFSHNTATGNTSNVITNATLKTGEVKHSQDGNVDSVLRIWTGTGNLIGIIIEETISLTKGANYYTRIIKIKNNTGKALENVRVYIGGDVYFQGNDASYSNWNQMNNEIYCYQGITNGVMSLRGGDTSQPDYYDAGYWKATTGAGDSSNYEKLEVVFKGKNLRKRTMPHDVVSQRLDSQYYLQWGSTENPMNINAGSDHTIEVIESFSDRGALQMSSPGGRTAPPNAVVSYNFTLRNMVLNNIDDMDIDLAISSQNGWQVSVNPDSLTLGSGNTVNVTANVVIPGNAADGATDILTLSASYYVKENGGTIHQGTVSGTTMTTVDYSVPYISQVKIVNLDNNNLDAMVHFVNAPGTRDTTIKIISADGTDTTVVPKTKHIASGGIIEGIDISSLTPGRYYLYVTADGIDYPHNTTYFDMGDFIKAITGIDVNPKNASLIIGEHIDLIKTLTPGDTTDTGVIWTSSNPSVATVDQNGRVTAVSPGEVKITVTSTADLMLSAESTIKVQSLVKFVTNGGTPVPADQRIDKDGYATQPQNITKAGYTLEGWYTTNLFTTKWNFAANKVMNNMTLYANWTANNYKVTYNGNAQTGGTVPVDSANYQIGMPVTIQGNPGNLYKIGHDFAGWTLTPDGLGTVYTAGNTYTIQADHVTFYAKWTPHNTTYKVTYAAPDKTGGTVPTDAANYQIHQTVTVKSNTGNLYRAGYEFAGWTTAPNGQGTTYPANATFMITGNVTLYAKWTANSARFNVTYNGNANTGGTVPVQQNYAIHSDVLVQNPGNLYKAGMNFDGWNTRADGTGTAYAPGSYIYNLQAHITLYAQWSGNSTTFKVTYNGNGQTGGTVPSEETHAIHNDVQVKNADLYKAGKNFAGWNTRADGTGTTYAVNAYIRDLTANVTLYALWTDNTTTYKVTYNGNGQTGGIAPAEETHKIHSDVQVKSFGSLYKQGKDFAGWNTRADGSGTAYAVNSFIRDLKVNTILYAQWTDNSTTFKVTYNGNSQTGGTVPAEASYPIHSDVQVKVHGNLYKAGKDFAGWNTKADGTGIDYAANSYIRNLTTDITLYAKWTNNTTTYKVTYNGNGQTGGTAPAEVSYPIHSDVQVKGQGNLYKAGKDFDGWNTRADGTGTSYAVDAYIRNLTSNVTLYAQWKNNNTTYKVTYNGNGQTGGTAPAEQILPIHSDVQINAQGNLYRAGKNFTGWNTKADGTGTSYAAGSYIRDLRSNVLLYAQWSDNSTTYKVSYNGNGQTGGTIPSEARYPIHSNVSVAGGGNLYKAGKNFTGWNTKADGTGTAYAGGATMYDLRADVILYAQWSNNTTTFKVTYNGNNNTNGTAPAEETHSIHSDVQVKASGTLYKAGKDFDSWNTRADGSGTTYAVGAYIRDLTANVTLYAQWRDNSTTYKVTYNGNGQTGGTAPGEETHPIYSDVQVRGSGNLYKAGKDFAGWNTRADGSGTAYAVNSYIRKLTGNITLYAQWTNNNTKFKVSYDGNGQTGGIVPSQMSYPIHSDVEVAVSGSLYKQGMYFHSWNTMSDGSGTSYDPGDYIYNLTGDMTLYAQWSVDNRTFKVTYNGNGQTGGIVPAEEDHPAHSRVQVKTSGNLYKAGMEFSSWNTKSDGTGETYAPGSYIEDIMKNTTLYAQWTASSVTYNVTYHGNGQTNGSAPAAVSHPIHSDVRVLGQGGLYKAGKDFNGWNTRADGSGTAYAVDSVIRNLTSNVDLYAQWIDNTTIYTVTYNGNGQTGGTAPAPDPHAIHSDVLVKGPSTLYKAGKEFASWNTRADGTGTTYAANSYIRNLTGNITLYAQWSNNATMYKVTYNGNGNTGGDLPAEVSYPIHSDIQVNGHGNLYKAGKEFAGWNTRADGSGTAYAANSYIRNLTVNMTLFAQWTDTSVTYKVTYNGNGQTGGTVPVEENHAIHSDVQVKGHGNLYRAGAEFTGWNTRADGSGTTYAANSYIRDLTANTTLYAQWRNSSTTYLVAYNGNGQTGGTVPASESLPIHSRVVVKGHGTLYRQGKTFSGWNTRADGSGTLYATGSYIEDLRANITLYAQWTDDATTYTVSYNGNGNSGGTLPAPVVHQIHSRVKVQDIGNVFKEGKVFKNWNTNANGTGTAYNANDFIEDLRADTTLYAQWETDNRSFTVTYDANGAIGGTVPGAETKPVNTNYQVKANTGNLYKAGYQFDGWNTKADGTGTTYQVGNTFRLTGNTTLYVKWRIDNTKLTVSYDGNTADAGTVPAAPVQYPINSNITVLGNTQGLVKVGYLFKGWNTQPNGSGTTYQAGAIFRLQQNTTLYAIWQVDPNNYSVTYLNTGADGGTVPTDPTSYQMSQEVTVKGNPGYLYKVGYRFGGWKLDSSAGVYQENQKFRITGNATLVPNWIYDNGNTYKVTYDKNGADSGNVTDSSNYLYEAIVTVKGVGDLTREAYFFKGWNTKADGSGINYNYGGAPTTFHIIKDTTLYAQWERYPDVNIEVNWYHVDRVGNVTLRNTTTKTDFETAIRTINSNEFIIPKTVFDRTDVYTGSSTPNSLNQPVIQVVYGTTTKVDFYFDADENESGIADKNEKVINWIGVYRDGTTEVMHTEYLEGVNGTTGTINHTAYNMGTKWIFDQVSSDGVNGNYDFTYGDGIVGNFYYDIDSNENGIPDKEEHFINVYFIGRTLSGSDIVIKKVVLGGRPGDQVEVNRTVGGQLIGWRFDQKRSGNNGIVMITCGAVDEEQDVYFYYKISDVNAGIVGGGGSGSKVSPSRRPDLDINFVEDNLVPDVEIPMTNLPDTSIPLVSTPEISANDQQKTTVPKTGDSYLIPLMSLFGIAISLIILENERRRMKK